MASIKSEIVELIKSEVDDDQEFKMGNVNSSHEFHHPTPLPGYFTCNICDFESKKKYGLDKHIKLLHRSVGGPSNVMECNRCNLKFARHQLLKNHKRARHLNEKRFSCNTCDYKSFYNQAVQNHVKTKHKDSNTAISLKLSEIDGPVISLKLGEGPKKVPKIDGLYENRCTECSFVTQKVIYLKRHLQLSHGQDSDPLKIIHCESCEFETLRTKSLVDHTNAQHLNQKRYNCSKCGFKSYYDQHVQSHIATNHPKSESEVERISCNECRFNREHVQCIEDYLESKKQNFACNYCDVKFMTNQEVIVIHMKSFHPEQKLFHCNNCSYRCNWLYNLRNHKKAKHKSEATSKDESLEATFSGIIGLFMKHVETTSREKI